MTHQGHLDALANLQAIVNALLADVEESVPKNPSEDTPERRRRYIRNIIALVEGTTAAMRGLALADAKAKVTRFSPGEIAILRGKTYELDDEGVVHSRPSNQKLVRNVRFSFAALARTYDAPFTLKVDGAGWKCFRATIKVRNRLVHPRAPLDLEVTDAEIRDASTAHGWYAEQNIGVSDAILASRTSKRENQDQSFLITTPNYTGNNRRRFPQWPKSL